MQIEFNNAHKNGMTKECYNVTDFCFAYTLSRSEFYREVKSKRLPVIKRGRRTYITRSDAEIWLDKQRRLRDEATDKAR